MSGFIAKSACLGRRPSQFSGFAGYQRSVLMGRLLRERSIARFVVAPYGYGKTSLLLDYAETIFSWVHVFWINAQSPCFIRDLDEQTIAEDCRRADPDLKLVVFDDLPPLDPERAERFSGLVDELLSAKCEVLVACTPRCDVYGMLQRDRMRLDGEELLLSDEELDETRNAGKGARATTSDTRPAKRVPCLVWSDDADAPTQFLKNTLKEQMPSDLLLGMVSMFAMHTGALSALRAFGPLDLDLVGQLAKDYPHLGFDGDTGRFQTPEVNPEYLPLALKGALAAALERSSFKARENLVGAWADALLADERNASRACALVRFLCPKGKRARWLAKNAFDLAGSACFFEGTLLARAIRATPKDGTNAERGACIAFEAVCGTLMGDTELALKAAKRVAFESTASVPTRVTSLIALSRIGNDLVRTQADAELEALAARTAGQSANDLPWRQLAASWLARESPAETLDVWANLSAAETPQWVRDLTAAWFIRAATAREAAPAGAASPSRDAWDALGGAIAYVRASLSDSDSDPDYYAASAGLALEEAIARKCLVVSERFPSSMLYKLRKLESAVAIQREAYEALARAENTANRANANTALSSAKASAAAGASPLRQPPILKLQMFGRFEAWIGESPLDDRAFRRRHVRLLLLILAMNVGREMPRETLCRMLWPESDADAARKSFYTSWSKLRRALTLPDGTCPYLVRHQFGVSLTERYVQSDIVRLNEICRELLFGKTDIKGWGLLYAELERDFSTELLPAETDSEIVGQMREECQSKLVDALVSATLSVIDGGNLQLATWFARAAVGHGETREDAYVALMRAQIANKQRTAAMDTYHRCRRVLAEQLGVDPSPETTALYESLLHSERG